MTSTPSDALDRDNPWPGLAPFDEQDRAFFHGRQSETADLAALVRREPLSVLFGRSGLGKSSLLKAGLFPTLRTEEMLPVYVRLDHAAAASSLREQLLSELRLACSVQGVQAHLPADASSLWDHFHRRDAEFWSALNRPLTPVIVLDQFEEIFTVGQQGVLQSERSAAFLAELADLVENRPDAAVKQALERDPALTARYDFRRAAVKLVLSFREDFLAEVEGLKQSMPSLMYNRLRLLPMNGSQAYAVVTRAGGSLVDDEVARCILRLAWKNEPAPPIHPNEFARIEIDPALLSVVCSELNHKRQQAAQTHIDQALLAGADREILAGFYERAMQGLDPRVRAFVEDELITDRGFRDSHDWTDALALPGLDDGALQTLIERRLLRVDERQGQRRLELTHDVLTRVVQASRDQRRAREAEAAAQAREQLAALQQRRNRRNAAWVSVGVVLMALLALLAGWQTWQARQARAAAEGSRLEALTQQQRASDAATQAQAEQAKAAAAAQRAAVAQTEAEQSKQRAMALGVEAGEQRALAGELVARAQSTRLMAEADALGPERYDLGLLLNVEAVRAAPTLLARAGLMQRLDALPHLERFLARGQKPWRAVALSPDGKRVAAAGSDRQVLLWDRASGTQLAPLDGHDDSIFCLAFHPNGRWLASGSVDGSVIIWDLASSRVLHRLAGHQWVTALAFDAAGKVMVTGGFEGEAKLWNPVTGQPLAELKGEKGVLEALAISPDGKRLATNVQNGSSRTLQLWDLESRQPIASLDDPAIRGLAFSPDGKALVTVGKEGLVVVRDDLGRLNQGLVYGNSAWGRGDRTVPTLYAVAFSHDGRYLIAAGEHKTVAVWQKFGRQEPMVVLRGHHDQVNRLSISADDRHLATAANDGAVILWDLGRRRPGATLQALGPINDLGISADGRQAVTAGGSGNATLWDLAERRPLASLTKPDADLSGSAFSPDGRTLALAGRVGGAWLWKPGASNTAEPLGGNGYPLNSIRFRPDGKQLAAASDGGEVLLWDAVTRRIGGFKAHVRDVVRAVYSPDGKQLATSSWDKTVVLWDVATPKRVRSFDGLPEVANVLAFSPDGRHLAYGDELGSVEVRDLASGSSMLPRSMAPGKVRALAYSSDGQWLAGADDRGALHLWQPDNVRPLARLQGHLSSVSALAFSPDSRQLLSAGSDRNLVVWDLGPPALTAEACQMAGRNLSCAEWRQQFGPDTPYRKTCTALPMPPEVCR